MSGFASPRAALVCLDLQRGRETAKVRAKVDQCRRMLAEARRRRWPVLHVHDRAVADPRPIAGLEPKPSEPVFLRQGPSAFSNPRFAQAALALGGPLALIGFALEDTVLATAFAAADRGLAVDVITDAVAAAERDTETVERVLSAPLRALAPRVRLLSFAQLFVEEPLAAANRP